MGLQRLLLLPLLSSSYLSTRLKLLDVFLVHLLIHEVSKDMVDAPLMTSEPVVLAPLIWTFHWPTLVVGQL